LEEDIGGFSQDTHLSSPRFLDCLILLARFICVPVWKVNYINFNEFSNSLVKLVLITVWVYQH